MATFDPACMATSLGSFPLTDARAACDLVFEFLPRIPAWPQLPQRAFGENLYVQFSQGLPGAVVGEDSIYVDRSEVDEGLEKLYEAYLSDSVETLGAVSPANALGLSTFLGMRDRMASAVAVKGQITGPISLGLQITDVEKRPIIYDDVLADAAAKLLRMKATWQESRLRQLGKPTMIFVDEPSLSTYGSAYVAVNRNQVVTALEEVFEGIEGLKGLHCCGNTDWSLLLSTSVDIISFDAYNFSVPFALYANDVREFLRRGGIIAWGIVPNDAELLGEESADRLSQRLLGAMDLLVQKGLSLDELLHRSLVTTSCGLGTLPIPLATQACELVAAVSAQMGERL